MDFVCIDDVSVRVFLYVCGCEIGLEYIRRTQFGFGREKQDENVCLKYSGGFAQIHTRPRNRCGEGENHRQLRPAACSNTNIGMA